MPQNQKNATSNCHECTRRRIKCDLTMPECKKCVNKGLRCSGPGKFRFIEGVATRGKLKGTAYESSKPKPASRDLVNTSTATEDLSVVVFKEKPVRYDFEISSIEAPPLKQWLPAMSSTRRDLFSHFQSKVLSILVPSHMEKTGLDECLMCLGTKSDLLAAAICVVAEQHKAQCGAIRNTLKLQRQRAKIIAKLRTLHPESDSALIMPVLLVMLMGDQVCGDNQFRNIIGAMKHVRVDTDALTSHNRSFLLIIQEAALAFIFTSVIFMGGVLTYEEITPSLFRHVGQAGAEYPLLYTMKIENYTLEQAFFIIVDMIGKHKNNQFEEVRENLSKLRDITKAVKPDTLDEQLLRHLVFLSALSCETREDLDYFLSRMWNIYNNSKFRSVLVGIEYIEEAWDKKTGPSIGYADLGELETMIM